METSYAVTTSGSRIHVDPGDVRGERLVAMAGDLNPLSMVLWHLALRLHPWELVVDVGANYGEMLVGAPIPAGADVVAFEPNLALHPHLSEVPVTTLDDVVGPTPRACCIKVDVEGHEPEVLEGAIGILAGSAPYAVMLESHHLSASFLADLAARRATYLMDRRTHRLVRIPGGNARLADRMRTSAWLYPQDCLVLSADLAP